jgi:regulator of nucleoside diphosphate kinase
MHTVTRAMPPIILAETEEAALTNLVASLLARDPGNRVARTLLAELERADVVAVHKVPPTVVRMNCVVEFQIDRADIRKGKLVFPGNADIGKGYLSILSPIGTALIGLAVGQSIRWWGHDGRSHELTVLAVEPPADV